PRRLKGPPPTGCLQQNKGQDNRVGGEFDPDRLKRSKRIGSDSDAGQQPDEDGKHPSPNGWNAASIDEKNVQVHEDFDQDQSRIEHAIGIEDESDRHGERRKPVAERTVYKRRKQGDPCKNDQCGVNWRHLWFLSYQAERLAADTAHSTKQAETEPRRDVELIDHIHAALGFGSNYLVTLE